MAARLVCDCSQLRRATTSALQVYSWNIWYFLFLHCLCCSSLAKCVNAAIIKTDVISSLPAYAMRTAGNLFESQRSLQLEIDAHSAVKQLADIGFSLRQNKSNIREVVDEDVFPDFCAKGPNRSVSTLLKPGSKFSATFQSWLLWLEGTSAKLPPYFPQTIIDGGSLAYRNWSRTTGTRKAPFRTLTLGKNAEDQEFPIFTSHSPCGIHQA